ncbi:MAG: STAS domain-containing protein [Planctomycetota bacterium]|jgi:anti-anti-sigma factor
MQLEVNIIRKEAGVVVFSLVGSIDSNTCAVLDEKIESVLAEPVKTIMLDMEGVDSMTSAGVGVITKARNKMKQKDGHFGIVNLQPQIEKVFEVMRLLPSLNVFASTEELDEYLEKIQRRIKEEGTSLSSE